MAVAVPVQALSDEYNSYMVCGTRFDVEKHYILQKPLGQGAYGVVCSALDQRTGEQVAIKKITRLFDKNVTDVKRILREIRLLRHLRHENVLSCRELARPPSYGDFHDLYIISEQLDTDLHQIIRSPQALTDEHIQYFVYQILRGLKYMHSANVLHRDLKPSNLLVNANCDLKICDFGNSRVADVEDGDVQLTEYVTTRWFRAPECLLGCKEYTSDIDVWSVGCILGELLSRKPMFPGKEYIHQLHLIMDVIGTPSDADLEKIASDRAKRYIKSCPFKPKIPFRQLFPNASDAAVDLLDKVLVFNPQRRCSVDEALAHPYLASLHDPKEEPVAREPFVFEFEHMDLTKDDLKRYIFQEIVFYHPEIAHWAAAPAQPQMAPNVAGDAMLM